MNAPTHCSYVYDRYECPLPISADNNCILHAKAEGKDEAQFLDALRRKIRSDQEDQDVAAIHLEGIIVPGEFTWRDVVDGLEIKKPVRFSRATFSASADADFSEATFAASTDFSEATFTANAYFFGATFTANAYFFGAAFSVNAYFSGATFAASTDFSEATFANANFSGATFSTYADFSGATFADASFNGAAFKQRLTFQSINPPHEDAAEDKPAPEGETPPGRSFRLNFSSVVLEQPQLVSFEDVDLTQASFLYTNLSHVRFIAVAWAEEQERLWRIPLPASTHYQIGDHVTLEQQWKRLSAEERQQRAALVADEYRQLRMNLESDHQEIEAGHFYIGQMDMRRLDTNVPWQQRTFLSAYRFLAMYGQSAWRPLVFYLLLSLALGLTYLMTGTVTEVADHHWAWGGRLFFLSGDFWKAFFLAASAGALLRDSVHGTGAWGAALVYLNTVADIFLIALFGIALRRHFHR